MSHIGFRTSVIKHTVSDQTITITYRMVLKFLDYCIKLIFQYKTVLYSLPKFMSDMT